MESEACRHLEHYNESKSTNVLRIFDGWLGVKIEDEPLSIVDSYTNCGENKAVYTALNIEAKYNISEMVDLSELEKIMDEIKSTPIEIPPVHFMNEDLADILEGIDSALNLDYDSFRNEMGKNLTTEDVHEILEKLNSLQNEPTIDNPTLVELTERLNSTFMLAEDNISDMKTHLESYLDKIQQILNGVSLINISHALNDSENIINKDGDNIIGNYINRTADETFEKIKKFADDTEYAVRNTVGRCKPAFDSIKYVIDEACKEALWPINGLWFCLGWCLFFLIPGIILSFKLTTLYRKTLPYKTKSSKEGRRNHPLYDGKDVEPYAAKTSNAQSDNAALLPKNKPPPKGMHAMTNPVYSGDDATMEFQLPRPQVITPRVYPPFPPEPDYAVPHKRGSPPPKYSSDWKDSPDGWY